MRSKPVLIFLAILTFSFVEPTVAMPATYPVCPKPDASFQSFLTRFTNDIEFQRSRLVLPLIARAGDGATSPATVDVWSMKDVRKLQDPLIYSTAELKKLNIGQSVDLIHDQSPSVAEVWQQERGGSDAIKLQYWFRKYLNGCWALAEFDNWDE